MSEPSSVGPEKTTPPKKPISPARNIIGLVILAAVLVVCWFEYSAVLGFNAAVRALEARTQSENQDLATVAEAETLLGRPADGPAEDFTSGALNFNKRTYTWKGILKQHTLTAYYTKEEKDPRLHHFETEGKKYDLQANQPTVISEPTGGGAPAAKGQSGRGGGGRGGAPKGNGRSDSKGKTAAPGDKAATPKAEPTDKAATPKAEPSDKAATPKAEPSDKAATPKAEPGDKAATPKAEPSDKAATPKPEEAKAKASDADGKVETPK